MPEAASVAGFQRLSIRLSDGRVERMVAATAAAKLRAEVRALDLVELLELTPGFVAHRAGNIDL